MKFYHYKRKRGGVSFSQAEGGRGGGAGHKHFGGSFNKGNFSHAEEEGQTALSQKV